jgi:acyl-CoA reductase-like NAD-dependent aldehyde dehydrogenase
MSTDVGPMINANSADRVEMMLEDAKRSGAQIVLSPNRADCTLSPTIVTNAPAGCRLMSEEAFGPVAFVNPFSNLAEAIEAANATLYGLQASCFTSDLGTA